jgi:hypothetical protein
MRRIFSLHRIALPQILFAVLVCATSASAKDEAKAPQNSQPKSVSAQPKAANLPTQVVQDAAQPTSKQVDIKLGVRLILQEEAQVEPKYSSMLPVGLKGAKLPVQTVVVNQGRVAAVVPSGGPPHGVLLQAPDKILGISTGGRMVLSVSERTIAIAAMAGNVLVGQGTKFQALPDGRMRVFDRATGMSRDVPLPSAPQIITNRSFFAASPDGVRVPLSAVDQKSALLLALVDQNGKRVGPLQHIAAGQPIAVTLPYAGNYFAVARTVDQSGVLSAPGEPLRLRAVGAAPESKAPRDGVYFLDHGERLKLAGVEGLEMRYGTSPVYAAATSSIGLSQNRLTRVELRAPGDPESAIFLLLAPRFMDTSISLGPVDASWPGTPIQMIVGIRDGLGRRVVDDGAQVEVLVNTRKVPVDWEESSEGLRAELESQQGSGPWVVRVNVKDTQGRTIARDFLEIVEK